MIPVCKDMEGPKLIGETGATLDMNYRYAYDCLCRIDSYSHRDGAAR